MKKKQQRQPKQQPRKEPTPAQELDEEALKQVSGGSDNSAYTTSSTLNDLFNGTGGMDSHGTIK